MFRLIGAAMATVALPKIEPVVPSGRHIGPRPPRINDWPHTGKRERARRMRQIAAGSLRAENGLVTRDI